MLTDLPTLHRFLRIPPADTTQDALLTDWIAVADAVIRQWTKRNLETQSYTEYRDGTGTADLWLRNRPVLSVAAVYLDAGGFYGDGITPFLGNTQLALGKDFVLLRDQPDGTSKSGILRRLGGGITGATLDWPWEWRKGTLTARMPPAWPAGYGNVKIQYTAGLGFGAPLINGALTTLPANTTLPPELTFACNSIVAWIRSSTPVGTPLAEDTVSNTVRLLNRASGGSPELGTARQILTRYRENAF